MGASALSSPTPTNTPQHVIMHQHVAHPPGPEPTPGLLDSVSDTLLNAFSRVRKPDDRFLSLREGVDRFEDGLVTTERLYSRVRTRTSGEWIGVCIFGGGPQAERR